MWIGIGLNMDQIQTLGFRLQASFQLNLDDWLVLSLIWMIGFELIWSEFGLDCI